MSRVFVRQRTLFTMAWTLLDSTQGFSQKGDFDHAVDDSCDSFGVVADWLALECWRQPYPPTVGGSRDCFGH